MGSAATTRDGACGGRGSRGRGGGRRAPRPRARPAPAARHRPAALAPAADSCSDMKRGPRTPKKPAPANQRRAPPSLRSLLAAPATPPRDSAGRGRPLLAPWRRPRGLRPCPRTPRPERGPSDLGVPEAHPFLGPSLHRMPATPLSTDALHREPPPPLTCVLGRGTGGRGLPRGYWVWVPGSPELGWAGRGRWSREMAEGEVARRGRPLGRGLVDPWPHCSGLSGESGPGAGASGRDAPGRRSRFPPGVLPKAVQREGRRGPSPGSPGPRSCFLYIPTPGTISGAGGVCASSCTLPQLLGGTWAQGTLKPGGRIRKQDIGGSPTGAGCRGATDLRFKSQWAPRAPQWLGGGGPGHPGGGARLTVGNWVTGGGFSGRRPRHRDAGSLTSPDSPGN